MHVSISSRLTIFWDSDTWKFQKLPDQPAALNFSSWSIFEDSGEGETGTRGKISQKKGRKPTINSTSIDAGTIQPGGGGGGETPY